MLPTFDGLWLPVGMEDMQVKGLSYCSHDDTHVRAIPLVGLKYTSINIEDTI